jgi:hypothetical protein
MTRKMLQKHEGAVEYWKQEKCECHTCRDTGGGYKYDIPNTHVEAEGFHGFFEILDFEKGVGPS